jgi:uncharacterized protein (DUF362 family)/NAD-dependent dihydropyrimidine dehydrogenase PreA subunit
MKVLIQNIAEYDLFLVRKFIEQVFEELQLELRLKDCRTVLLKPNLLGPYEPARAVTTHPVIVEALIIKLQNLKKEVWLGDSPGGSLPVKRIFTVTGMEELCRRYSVKLINFNTEGIERQSWQGREYNIAKPFFLADAVINLAKYKTHSLMYYTGCIKNLFGLIPGLKKSDYHKKFPTYQEFSTVISDIYSISQTQVNLNILDGIIGMEGEGPSAGKPRSFGLLFASESGAALDWQAAKMMGLKKNQMQYIYQAMANENLTPEDILTGRRWQNFSFEKVKIKKVSQLINLIQHSPGFLQNAFRKAYQYYPDFNDNCVLCGVCRDSCPVQAITITSGDITPVIDLDTCIKCMCCHELCPHQAVFIHKSFLARFLVK